MLSEMNMTEPKSPPSTASTVVSEAYLSSSNSLDSDNEKVGDSTLPITIDVEEALVSLPLISRSDCSVLSLLGSGSFCDVYEAQINALHENDYDNNNNNNNNDGKSRRHYAMKLLNKQNRHDLQAITDLITEASILHHLNHENIISFHGIVKSHSKFYVVLDLVQETLQDKLNVWRYQQVTASVGSLFKASRNKFTSKKYILSRIQTIAVGIVNAMQYISSQGIVHRDLKPANIGFDKQGNVKLLDFGFARSMADHQEWANETAGTLRYMPPEIAFSNKGFPVGLPVDVYSFGMLLYELCSLSVPFSHIHSKSEFKKKVFHENARPNLKSIERQGPQLQRVCALMESAWQHDPSKRPTFTILQANLREVAQQYQKEQEGHCHHSPPCKIKEMILNRMRGKTNNKIQPLLH